MNPTNKFFYGALAANLYGYVLVAVFSLIILAFITTITARANASEQKRPILVEMFASNSCSGNPPVQKRLRELYNNNDDVIYMGCWMKAKLNSNNPAGPYARSFCDSFRIGYYNEMGLMALKNPMIVVNGHYDASLTKIDAAVKLARSADNTARIKMEFANNAIDISIPDIKSAESNGVILLYSYAIPEEDRNDNIGLGYTDPNGQPVDKVVDGDTFVAQKKPVSKEDYIRPIIAMEKIADWNGSPMSMAHPIENVGLSSDKDVFGNAYSKDDIGYVAVLHENHRFGSVLAVGELKPHQIAKAKEQLKQKQAEKEKAKANQKDSPAQ